MIEELRTLISGLRDHSRKHGCSTVDIENFCDKAEFHLSQSTFSEAVEDDLTDEE